MNKKIIFGAIVIILLLAGWWLYSEASKPLPGINITDQGRQHVDQKTWSTFNYNSNPPTSGPHDPVWTTKGIYKQTAQDIGKGHVLHSLEHGYIEFHYNCLANKSNQPFMTAEQSDKAMTNPGWNSAQCKNLVNQLTEIINEKTLWKTIMLPNPSIDETLAVAAWDRLDVINPANSDGTLSDSQKSEVEDFIDSFRDHGPEQTMEP